MKSEMVETLRRIGVNKKYKPYQDQESPEVLIRTRRPPVITNGFMAGCEIDLFDEETFRVWTSQVQKAMRLSKEYGLKIDLLDKECEVYIPISKADTLLPQFRAIVKRTSTPNQLANLKNGLFTKKVPINGQS